MYCFGQFQLPECECLLFHSGNPWIGSVDQPEHDKHARDIPFLDKYSLERWEVGLGCNNNYFYQYIYL